MNQLAIQQARKVANAVIEGFLANQKSDRAQSIEALRQFIGNPFWDWLFGAVSNQMQNEYHALLLTAIDQGHLELAAHYRIGMVTSGAIMECMKIGTEKIVNEDTLDHLQEQSETFRAGNSSAGN